MVLEAEGLSVKQLLRAFLPCYPWIEGQGRRGTRKREAFKLSLITNPLWGWLGHCCNCYPNFLRKAKLSGPSLTSFPQPCCATALGITFLMCIAQRGEWRSSLSTQWQVLVGSVRMQVTMRYWILLCGVRLCLVRGRHVRPLTDAKIATWKACQLCGHIVT